MPTLKTSVAIVLAGQIDLDLKTVITPEQFIIAVDGGLDHLSKYGLQPDILIGDLDSISDQQYQGSKLVFDSIKDDTDFVCALKYANENYPNAEINVFGFASLNRIDHVLANLSVINQQMTFISANQEIMLITENTTLIADQYKYYSFFGLESVNQFSLSGFKYPLTNYSLKPFDPLCVSNELVANSGTIELSNGRVILIKSKIN